MDDYSKITFLKAPQASHAPRGKYLRASAHLIVPNVPANLMQPLWDQAIVLRRQGDYEQLVSNRYQKFTGVAELFQYLLQFPEFIDFLVHEVAEPFVGKLDEDAIDRLKVKMLYNSLAQNGVIESKHRTKPSSTFRRLFRPDLTHALHAHDYSHRGLFEMFWSPHKSAVFGFGHFRSRELEGDDHRWVKPARARNGEKIGHMFEVPPGTLVIGASQNVVHGFPTLTKREIKGYGGARNALVILGGLNHPELLLDMDILKSTSLYLKCLKNTADPQLIAKIEQSLSQDMGL